MGLVEEDIIMAEKYFDQGKFETSNGIVTQVLRVDADNLNALMLRAKISMKLQRWGEALNDLNLVLALDDQHRMAQSYRQMVLNILTYWNKDNYNP